MKTLFIVDIEPLDNRYTKQWHTWIPELCAKHFPEYNILRISGDAAAYARPQAGAFFNFAGTCEYKAAQAQTIARMFDAGTVREGDVFFFTDAWNQTVHTVRYISELNQIPVKCAGIWHAGWYDPTDILGFTIKRTGWVYHLEQSMYCAYDMNFFGTKQHLDKFMAKHGPLDQSARVCGYPLEYIAELENSCEKTDTVVFPHRLNPDKAPYIFDALEREVHKTHPHIKFVKTQEQNLNKGEYYDLLKTCKVVFSANKHENLGIGTFEAMKAGCLPIVPNKLSYAEMYEAPFLYDVADDFYENPSVEFLAQKVIRFVTNYDGFAHARKIQADRIMEEFFTGTKMIEHLATL